MSDITFYKKKDGNLSSIKNRQGGMTFTFNPNGVMRGSSFRSGNLTTFNDAAFNPSKYGVKTGTKTYYYNKNWSPLK